MYPLTREVKSQCPKLTKVIEFLEEDEWKRTHMSASKTLNGVAYYLKFKKEGYVPNESEINVEDLNLGGNNKLINYTVELNLEEIKSTWGNSCYLNIIVNSYDPKKKLTSLNHSSEKSILGQLEGLVELQK